MGGTAGVGEDGVGVSDVARGGVEARGRLVAAKGVVGAVGGGAGRGWGGRGWRGWRGTGRAGRGGKG